MHPDADTLLNAALSLSAEDRTAMVEKLLESLHRERTEIDAAWAEEAERRIAAYRRGELDSIAGDQVMSSLPDNV